MNKTAQSVWKTVCLLLKTTFRTKHSKLGLNQSNQLNLPITHCTFRFLVNSSMVRRALCKTIKVALTKELGKMQSYFIKSKWKTLAINNRLRNNCQANRSPMKPQNVDAPFPRS
jgi:hypothetical protein